MIDISVVVPVLNEEGSLRELHTKLSETLEGTGKTYELLFVDDGSTDGSYEILAALHREDPNVRVLSFRRRYGKSAALSAGFSEAGGQVIVTIDADLQDDPAEIPKLIAKLDEGYDLVSGWKQNRRDPITKTIPSKFFNAVTGAVTGLKLHDMNCGLKAYRRSVTEQIHVYGQLHRFLPVFAQNDGFRVGEVPVRHHPRVHGKTKYGVRRLLHGFLDLLTVVMVTGYTASPLHFFGTIGVVLSLAGIVINCHLTYLRLTYGNIQGKHPLLMLGVLLMILGFQLISTGLLAELMTRKGHKGTEEYSIKARLSHDQERIGDAEKT